MKPGSADPHADVRFSSSGAVNRSNDAPLAGRLNLVIDGALARNRIVGTTILIFLEALRTRNNPILQPGSIELMTKNAIGALPAPSLDPGWRFGLGFAVLEDPKPTASPRNPGSWRWGGVYGNSFWVDPAAHLSVVALTNTAVAGMTGDFRDSVVRAVYTV